MDRRAWFWLLALGAIWGASYLFIAIGLRDFSPGMVAFLRVALAAAVLIPVAATRGPWPGRVRYAGWIVLVGAIQVAGPFLLIAAGEEEITSSLAGILVAATPLWTAVLAIWVDHEERSQGLRLVGSADRFRRRRTRYSGWTTGRRGLRAARRPRGRRGRAWLCDRRPA